MYYKINVYIYIYIHSEIKMSKQTKPKKIHNFLKILHYITIFLSFRTNVLDHRIM